ncbi:MAG TPA: hypothetical protein VKT33_13850 [Candidatus Angelobacter sp.]|nr:hypothetical protein [Candidatus Angelobacter sp.]
MKAAVSITNLKKALSIVVLLSAFVSGCRQQEKSQNASPQKASSLAVDTPATWITVEEFDYTLARRRVPVHFKLELRKDDEELTFTRIHIKASDQPEFVLDNDDGWAQYVQKDDSSKIWERLQKQNLVKSRYVLMLPLSLREREPPLIFLRSLGRASDADRLSVIVLRQSGQPFLILDKDLQLEEFADLDGDGYREIVGSPCLSEAFGTNLQTYDPFHVYKISHSLTEQAKLSIPLTKSWNLKHYYGWAGPDCSGKLAVVLHPPSGGKPLIMDADEAEKLMSGPIPIQK